MLYRILNKEPGVPVYIGVEASNLNENASVFLFSKHPLEVGKTYSFDIDSYFKSDYYIRGNICDRESYEDKIII